MDDGRSTDGQVTKREEKNSPLICSSCSPSHKQKKVQVFFITIFERLHAYCLIKNSNFSATCVHSHSYLHTFMYETSQNAIKNPTFGCCGKNLRRSSPVVMSLGEQTLFSLCPEKIDELFFSQNVRLVFKGCRTFFNSV